MTDEQINAAIAEVCGWECLAPDVWHHGIVGYRKHTHVVVRTKIPDYCNDLNAMYEAEEQMDEIDWVFFMNELSDLVKLPKQAEVQIKQLVHSTARHRAQALLRTLGKWKEGE
jgi:hypothetical protein